MKELRLNKGEKELVALAKKHGFEEWSYKSWRRDDFHVGYSLTKSIANKGEWSFVEDYTDGTRVKTTTRQVYYLVNKLKKIYNF